MKNFNLTYFSIFTNLVLIFNTNSLIAQLHTSEQLPGDPVKQARIKILPPAIKVRVDSAIKYSYDQKFHVAIKILEELLTMREIKQTSSLFRAWVYEWLALNYWSLNKDSLRVVKPYVQRSLKEDMDILPDHLDETLPRTLRNLYNDCRDEIIDRFNKKRRSLRFALGPVSRVDFSYRLIDNWHIVGGLGTSTKFVLGKEVFDNFKPADNSLLFMRIQWMRKNIERLAAGFFGEFTFPLKDVQKSARILGAGPILSYAHQSNWEIGSTFTVAQVEIGKNAANNLSQTAFKSENEEVVVTYGIFEIYLRKWF